jgi:hypothetical protein
LRFPAASAICLNGNTTVPRHPPDWGLTLPRSNSFLSGRSDKESLNDILRLCIRYLGIQQPTISGNHPG